MTSVNDYIGREVAGLTFADVGGLWGAVSERCSVAKLAGARDVTMIDVQPADSQLWIDFRAHAASLGVTGVREIIGNIEDPAFAEHIGSFDYVHCSGVIYHAPNPFLMLHCLKAITRKTLILASMTVPEVIETPQGRIVIDPAAPLAVPLIDAEQRRIMTAHFDRLGFVVHNVNSPDEHPWMWDRYRFNYGPWWWFWPPETLRRMAETVGFRVRDVLEVWEGRAHALICDVV